MVKKQGCQYIAAAAAVSPSDTAENIRRMVDTLIVLRVARTYSFAVASFYRDFHDMKDSEVHRLHGDAPARTRRRQD